MKGRTWFALQEMPLRTNRPIPTLIVENQKLANVPEFSNFSFFCNSGGDFLY